VFFATNRKIAEGSSFSLASILSVPSSELTYGLAIVSVPKNHRIGHVERPTSRFFGLIQQRGSDEDDFRIQTLSALSREALVDMLRRNPDSLLLFIHGYNVSFDAAVFKAAQIAYDASFEGSVMVFSWPSTGNLAAYDHDYQSALASPEALVSVLKLISAKVGTKKIFVVAHSLGNQILVDSLQQAALAHVNLNISELVLAAPDVDTNVFLAKASQIEAVSRHVTIYASSADKALLASGLKTLGLRLGYIGSQGPTLVSGIETIDVTAVGDDIFGLNHSAFSESAIALDDLGRIIDSGTHPPEVRTPILQSMPNRTDVKYWMFPK
jgi:esterase/lipase superfamily enzyme